MEPQVATPNYTSDEMAPRIQSDSSSYIRKDFHDKPEWQDSFLMKECFRVEYSQVSTADVQHEEHSYHSNFFDINNRF